MKEKQKLMTIANYALHIGCSRQQVYKLIWAGKLIPTIIDKKNFISVTQKK